MSEYETYAYFWVSDFDCEISEITRILNIEPTKSWKKGDLWRNNILRKDSRWELHSVNSKDEMFLEKHVESLLEILYSRRTEIALLKEYSFGVSCVGYYQTANLGFHLSSDLIKRCADLGVSLDFDLYCLEKDE